MFQVREVYSGSKDSLFYLIAATLEVEGYTWSITFIYYYFDLYYVFSWTKQSGYIIIQVCVYQTIFKIKIFEHFKKNSRKESGYI